MILIDLSQVMIASLMAQTRGGKDPISDDLVRHICLRSIANYRKKYHKKFGEVILCVDSMHYWRKDFFPLYKAHRKKGRDASDMDWNLIFECLNKVRDELRDHFPYRFINVYGCEADDVIGVLIEETKTKCTPVHSIEPIMIISGDKDFQQLQRYDKVSQYSPITRKEIVLNKDEALEYLANHIISGDKGDGIPNVLSQDDCIVEGIRQRPVSKKKRGILLDPLVEKDNEVERNFQRNRTLIDLTYIPNEYKKQILEEYENVKVASRGGILNYFIKHRLMELQDQIGDF